ncbi:SPFH domain-containing protein [Sphingomonas sp. H160509]|uniref:SPFH domain-containing protein n=1 Tax=Sphingomonas sp. H160509 TaxID=2955313 RepID=UPI0010E8F615|nr:MAG: hypothetical protein EOP89_01785 [Xanthomonadaceae bacterium]
MPYLFVIALPLIVLLVVASRTFGIIQEYQRAVLFRLGRLGTTKGPEWYWLIPFIDRVVKVAVPPDVLLRRGAQKSVVNKTPMTITLPAIIYRTLNTSRKNLCSAIAALGSSIRALERVRQAIGQALQTSRPKRTTRVTRLSLTKSKAEATALQALRNRLLSSRYRSTERISSGSPTTNIQAILDYAGDGRTGCHLQEYYLSF